MVVRALAWASLGLHPLQGRAINMKFVACLLVLSAWTPLMVYADSAAAASAAVGGRRASAAAAAAAKGYLIPVHCNCPWVYDPVCGTDGHTYSNACGLRCVNDYNLRNGRHAIGVHHKGSCPTVTCSCPKIRNPICGTNNHTYVNECYLECENSVRERNGLRPISVNYRAPCQKSTCVCPSYISPVCGTNGKTYQNVCIMQCYSRANQAHCLPPIYVKEKGACKIETCDCPNKKEELCASDRRTYYNDCALRCQNWRRSQLGQSPLTIKHRGKCPIECVCTAEYAPVCAKNKALQSIPFSNKCLFLCENERRKAANLQPLTLRWKGPCDCGCSNVFEPVCAGNKEIQKTFQNKCQLRCRNRKLEQDGYKKLSILHLGECKKKCDCRHCGNAYKPVCGSDRRTYWNVCWLKCTIACRLAAGYPNNLWKHGDGRCR